MMSKDEKEDTLSIINTTVQVQEEERELDLGSEELDPPLPPTVTSRVLYMLGDITAGPAYRFAQWLELVRKRSDKYRASGFPRRPYRLETMPSSVGESIVDSKSPPPEQAPEVSLWERLGKAAALDIESSSFSWDMLSSLHHTEHSSSTENSEDEMSKALEVTVNSGGVVFFALFNQQGNADAFHKESAAVIKFSSSRMATQSERLGYEFAKWLGVQTPQARVVQNSSPEWLQIKEAAEKARVTAASEGDEVGEVTCSELLEALELSRCLLLMSYVHGSPLLESSNAFEPRETGERIAAALGRVFLLDLVIRNEDRLPCRELRWRGNPANLLLAEKMTSSNVNALEVAFDSAINRYRPKVIKALQKERRATSLNSKFNTHNRVPGLVSQGSDVSDITESPKSNKMPRVRKSGESSFSDLISHAVAIDSGVPRRPPAEKRTNDQENYPKLIELLLNSSDYTSNLLYEVTGGKLGAPPLVGTDFTDTQVTEMASVVQEFRGGFRAALRDLQGFHVFLLTLHQKLDGLLRVLLNITNKTSGDTDREDLVIPESPSHGVVHYPSPASKERFLNDNHSDFSDSDSQRMAQTPRSSLGSKESSDSSSPMSRESWHGKLSKGSGEPLRSPCLTTKLREILKFAKVDTETNEELEHWNEMLRNDAIKLCQENNFNTGYFEGSDSNCVVDAYELKVRLEHILERISLISEAANTEKPSLITNSLFIGGTLAARSVYTLQHLGITHILCLCANEIGQSESQHPDLFQYKNFSVSGRVLVHCFEGRSRSATLVLAYLMLRKKFTLLEAWNALRRAHRRAQPNDGFAKALLDLDRQLHGKVSMEWQRRKPEIKVCPVCGDNAGLSSSSLKLHLQKSHKKLSSGSVDSAMTMEIQKALDALKMTRSGSVSPTLRPSSPSLEG
ncbi:dual specificity protein phosphatase PHS1-like isoform X2 [Populus nigra]|uniref:dual specificity protein phosphatase PHS1-like isoform X2 n=1 Tax=Populus nigra TaxID=3691 RepID=UPI002B26B998|nr:dual specificity protein phosphatase PHS1-like isoform X2 [Populus nigra]